MKKLLLVALATFAVAAQAEDYKIYVGGGAGFWTYTESGNDENFNLSSLELAAGVNVWKWFNVEGRLGAGLESAHENVTTKTIPKTSIDTEISLNNYASLYLKPELKNDVAKLYGLLGVSRVDAESATAANTRSLSVTGLSYGAGMGFQLSEKAVLNLEFRRLVQETDYRFSGFSIGFDIAL